MPPSARLIGLRTGPVWRSLATGMHCLRPSGKTLRRGSTPRPRAYAIPTLAFHLDYPIGKRFCQWVKLYCSKAKCTQRDYSRRPFGGILRVARSRKAGARWERARQSPFYTQALPNAKFRTMLFVYNPARYFRQFQPGVIFACQPDGPLVFKQQYIALVSVFGPAAGRR